jgi:hypothetical protein
MAENHDRVKALIEAAYAVVRDADVPESLQEIAFGKAFDLLAGSVPASPGPVAGDGGRSAEQVPADGDEPRLDKIAAKLRLDGDLIREVFHEEGGELALSLAASKFESTSSGATRQIALLLAAGRQAGGWDSDWTPQKEISHVVNDYGKLDQRNFSTTIGGMGEFGFSGSGSGRKVKVNRAGFEQAGHLVRELTGGDGT